MSGAVSLLVVDDNPTNLKLLSFLLASRGYDVHTADSAEQALAFLDEQVPALILLDIQLPGMNGLELTRVLRSRPATAGVAILAVTAYAMKGDEEAALAAGCDAYIAKPIDTRALPDTVAALLRRRTPEAQEEA